MLNFKGKMYKLCEKKDMDRQAKQPKKSVSVSVPKKKPMKKSKSMPNMKPKKPKVVKKAPKAPKPAPKPAPKKKMKPPPIPPNVKGKRIKPPVKKARKTPTRLYTLEGWQLMDEDVEEGEEPMLPFELEELGFEWQQTYPSGLQRFTARLTKKQLQDFDKYYGEIYEPITRLYSETKREKTFYYDMGRD